MLYLVEEIVVVEIGIGEQVLKILDGFIWDICVSEVFSLDFCGLCCDCFGDDIIEFIDILCLGFYV